jgi:hypothetical protein
MERLTKRDTDGQAMMDCQKCEADWTGKHGKPMEECTALYCRDRVKDRLAEYEDPGLMPKDVKRMSNILLDVGIDYNCSWEYVKNWLLDARLRELAEADKDGRLVVLPCKVGDTVYRLFVGNPDNPVIATLKINTVTEAVKLIGKMGMHKYIGTFLTREEAEAALEAMKDG